MPVANEKPFDLARRSWGGFDERPITAKCYRQERTALILSFVVGTLGVDQFYAHHWPLAVFKLLTLGGGGIWWFVDVILWMVGGVNANAATAGELDLKVSSSFSSGRRAICLPDLGRRYDHDDQASHEGSAAAAAAAAAA
ncbi:hypothetical protein MRS44_018173 [Fusarium solani]|uniref:uncharacterized protein n=1 Tax=Fusarium solani TaxID=169388 RepID=UPI0032C3E34D|nr:hypothetical protein MRS44_018173 [Fusarium solani]